jgi:GNAT superfamily N-acetyltransferase
VLIACVACARLSAELAELNRLAVLPAHRHRGIGARLVQHIVGLAGSMSVPTISIGIIGEHTDLQRGYRTLGFKDGELKRFAHLPFSVRYMNCAV